MDFKSILKSGIPLVIGILIGAGITKNRNVAYIVIGYIVFIMLFNLLKDKIMKVRKSKNKKEALKEQAIDTMMDFGEATLKGNQRGATLFDKYYKEYIFYVNFTVFIVMIYLLFKNEWLLSLLCFMWLHVHIILNQIVRNSREIKEGIKLGIQ